MDQRIEPVGACPFSAGESEHLVFQLEEMANMMSASRSYQTNVEVMNTAKTMLQRVLTLGQ